MEHEKEITIFCASSPHVPPVYFEAAVELTKLLARRGYGIRYGGGGTGLMGAVANTALEYNCNITGIIPTFMVEQEWEHKGVRRMIKVETMHERKRLLLQGSAGVITLPGGTGTLEELYESVSLKKLGFYPHPIILLNTNGYYDPLLDMARNMIDQNFTLHQLPGAWMVASTPADAVEALEGSDAGAQGNGKFSSC